MGKIDVEKAKASGYVTMEEKDKLGYYTPEVSSNKKVIKKAYDQKKEIYAHMTEVIGNSLGREIKILGMNAPFPYEAVDVSFTSLNEPIVTDSVTLGLSDNGYFNKGENGNGFQQATIIGLYSMAYRNEIEKMRGYIQSTYPQYEAYSSSMRDAAHRINPIISISFYTPSKQVERMENAAKEKAEIFSLFKENPNRSDDEWKAIFQQMSSLDYTISVELVLKDSNKLPLDEDANEILDDIKSNPLFSGYYGYASIIESNFQDTKINTGLVSIIQVWNPEIIKFEDFY